MNDMDMDQLRWILLGMGGLFVVVLALIEMRRRRQAARRSEMLHIRQEPGMEGAEDLSFDESDVRIIGDGRRDPPLVMLDDVEVPPGADSVDLGVVSEVAVDRPGVMGALQVIWPPAKQDRILWLRVVAPEGASFQGRALRQALASCGLAHGPQDIFHRANDAGTVLASAANLTRPGSFDLAVMDGQQFRGVHVFSVLPAPLSDLQTFDELLMLADEIATRLDGAVLDDTGGALTVERIDELRQALYDGAAAAPDDAGGP